MASVGRLLLILGFATAVYGLGASLYGGRARDEAWIHSGRRAMYALALISLVAFVILDAAFVGNDFSYNIVADGSSSTTPFLYRVAAIWSTQQGSLLLWVLLFSAWSSLALFLTRNKIRMVVPWAQATLFLLVGFFLTLNTFMANPFVTSSPAPAEGAGLDPLLRHTTMMVHPPMLYSGYTLMLIPFCFAVGALVSGRLNSEWIAVTRRFALGAWLFLGIGIVLGARWSYTELGWGGFWGWDPVENAALMPWLVATAFIHSIMIQEKRGMLRVWNVSLVMLAGVMAMVGDFLVRSGVLSSIHAFVPDPTLDVAFVVIVGVMTLGSIGLVLWRYDSLKSKASIASIFSREAMFVAQNMVLVALTLVIFWVTFFPLISQALTGNEITVGQAAFLPFIDPLAVAVVALAGIAPIIPWRRMSLDKLRSNFAFPLAAGLVALVVLLLVPGASGHTGALAMFCAAAFVVATVVQEFVRGTRVRRRGAGEPGPLALTRLVSRNRRRYGGYIVHLGVVIALVGVAASTSFQHQRRAMLAPGQSVRSDGYTFTYVRPVAAATPQKLAFGAIIRVSRAGHRVTTLRTVYGVYPSATSSAPLGRFFETSLGASDESTVGLDAGLTHDIWVVISANLQPLAPIIARGDRDFARAINAVQAAKLPLRVKMQKLAAVFQLRDRAVQELTDRWVTHPWPTQFLIEVSPLVTWLWLGAIIAAIGGLIALIPVRPRRSPDDHGPTGGRAARRGGRATAPATGASGPGVQQPARAGELVTRLRASGPGTGPRVSGYGTSPPDPAA
ncbi:MAG TPA: cytochrome c-type biogenesis CcmF C-terminal domain-containing protein [Solirubrobacteraceae bacterium]|nr:cytochrome c-type biogenesis CcmF C-terminal domain-containing protein [Solirubrobacteraceae bacterium]